MTQSGNHHRIRSKSVRTKGGWIRIETFVQAIDRQPGSQSESADQAKAYRRSHIGMDCEKATRRSSGIIQSDNDHDHRVAGVIAQFKTRASGGSACIVLLFTIAPHAYDCGQKQRKS